ncbi:MAG: hypothetical protein KJ718_04815 [Nanoarchaeota archaeon]|nr:hypothetical protein [Nanoarchaeota archaeon]MBU1051849.1 hypothetical protein [Nanoarchaeota archaeon]MBU1988231.1 hypothetical protein [Nanoarchaeota archaeon]
MDPYSENLVEAIEEGRIVKVPESYARREGLVILKKPEIPLNNPGTTPSFYSHTEKKEPKRPFTDYISKKPDWREQQVISELLDNFHWHIRLQRKRMGLTRKQFAKQINEPEEKIKILETGRLPTKDFILINKIQKALDINLRKDGKEFDLSTQEIMEKAQEVEMERIQQRRKTRSTEKAEEDYNEISGSGIEILEDEI